jgi:hypothetical protein
VIKRRFWGDCDMGLQVKCPVWDFKLFGPKVGSVACRQCRFFGGVEITNDEPYRPRGIIYCSAHLMSRGGYMDVKK